MPDNVLAQLGNRVQHALRAFTPRDQNAVQGRRRNLPRQPQARYRQGHHGTRQGGEALVSFLEGNGTPSMVERAIIAPAVRPARRDYAGRTQGAIIAASPVKGKYEQPIDSGIRLRGSPAASEGRHQHGNGACAGTGAWPAAACPRRWRHSRRHRRILGGIFGTSTPRGTRLSTGQLITRKSPARLPIALPDRSPPISAARWAARPAARSAAPSCARHARRHDAALMPLKRQSRTSSSLTPWPRPIRVCRPC